MIIRKGAGSRALGVIVFISLGTWGMNALFPEFFILNYAGAVILFLMVIPWIIEGDQVWSDDMSVLFSEKILADNNIYEELKDILKRLPNQGNINKEQLYNEILPLFHKVIENTKKVLDDR